MQIKGYEFDSCVLAKGYISTIVCCFVGFSVTFLNSYNIFASLLLLSYVFFLSPNIRNKIRLKASEKVLVGIMLLFVTVFLMEFLLFDADPRILDKPAKVLLLIPLVFLLNAIRPGQRSLIFAFLVSSGALLCFALYERYVFGISRVGQLINPIQFSAISIAIASAAIALSATISHQTRKRKLLLCGGLLLSSGGLVAGVMSQSRGSIICIPVVFIILAILFFHKETSKRVKLLALGITIMLFASALFLYGGSTIERFETAYKEVGLFQSGQKTATSSGIRLGLWGVSVEAGLQSPIIGVGLEQYVDYKNDQVNNGRYGQELLRYDNAHNTYVNAFARRGLVGLAAVILFLGFPICLGLRAWRKQPNIVAPYAAALTAFGCVFFISNFTQEVIFLNTGIIMYTGLLIILTSLLNDRINAVEEVGCNSSGYTTR
ncbi:O-antigen ligase family protein [Neptuniibacter sp. QD37_6]|uniref:O-antigen ligase family protein n=1 Tax=Neptuniibacter sp. QD37_6 TaxID=3398210 RepID=UPI0039F47B61